MTTLLRADGRPSSSLRPLACELGSLQNCDGSALWKSGATHVLASVHGPLAPRLAHHERETAVVSVVIKSGNSSSGGDGPAPTYEREWEHVLTTALSSAIVVESYPRSVVQIVIQILSADGSLLAACLHAAVSALLDAGVELRFLPTASTCLLHSADGDSAMEATTVSLDPTSQEEQSAGTVVIVTTPDNKILASHTSFVEASMETILKCCSVACRAGPAVIAFWRLVLEQKATREAQTLWA